MRFIVMAAFALVFSCGAALACPDWQRGFEQASYTGQDLRTGITLPLFAGGNFNLQACALGNRPGEVLGVGFVPAAPTFTFQFDPQGADSLVIEVESGCDPTLLVNTADEVWLFNDDFSGLNPAITLVEPDRFSGRIDLWIGTFSANASCNVNLQLRATGVAPPGSVDTQPDPNAICPSFATRGTSISMSAVQFEDPQLFPISTGVLSADLGECPNTQGVGVTPVAPQFTFELAAMSGYQLFIGIEESGGCDTVLLVNTADAEWHFNDDRGPNDLNSTLILDGPGIEGRIDIWFGTFFGNECSGTLVMQARRLQ
ncbi:MAG: hypothetical protein AAF914_04505 [Pseudomonadota bacterium]